MKNSTLRSLHQTRSPVAQLVVVPEMLICTSDSLPRLQQLFTFLEVLERLTMRLLAHSVLQHWIKHCMSWYMHTKHSEMFNCGATLNTQQASQVLVPRRVNLRRGNPQQLETLNRPNWMSMLCLTAVNQYASKNRADGHSCMLAKVVFHSGCVLAGDIVHLSLRIP